jgi:hypothetical protein
MNHRAAPVLAALLILCAIAPAPAPAQRVPAPLTSGVFVATQLRLLRGRVTLGAWLRSHPHATAARFAPGEQADGIGNWCARVVDTLSIAGGLPAITHIWFFGPPPPPSFALPVDSGAALFGRCEAGLVSSSILVRAPYQADSLARALTTTVVASEGLLSPPPEFPWEEYEWAASAHWFGHDVDIITGAARQEGMRPGDSAAPPAARFIAASRRSGMSLAFDRSLDNGNPDALTQQLAAQRLREMRSIAAVTGPVRDHLEHALAALGTTHDDSLADPEPFLSAFADWLALTRTLPPPRRAAAYFLAEDALARSAPLGWGDDKRTDLRHALELLGASFAMDPIDKSYVAGGHFLLDAVNTAPGSRANDVAFLTLANNAFQTGTGCINEGADTVIARVTPRLRQFPHSTVNGELQLALARAHGEAVYLGDGGGFEADSESAATYRTIEPRERATAIAEYRVALGTLRDVRLRRRAWTEAWRLQAGLSPVDGFFYCQDD